MRSQSTQVHCSNMGFLAHVRQVQPGKVYFKFELNWVIKEPLCYCYIFTFLTPLEKLILRTFLNNNRDEKHRFGSHFCWSASYFHCVQLVFILQLRR